MSHQPHTIILTPLYRDEASFGFFARELENLPTSHRFSVLVVNDGTPNLQLQSPIPLTVIHLHRNIGHQKAIAIGMAYACEHLTFDHLVIMDCDGEDKVGDIGLLLEQARVHQQPAVATRASRQEGRQFRFFYALYRSIFYLMTGKRIRFGNFMALPYREARRLVFYPELWNHLAGSLIKSKTPFRSIPLHRGKRYAGSSHMNFNSLLLHGLNAFAVFLDIISVRLLTLSLTLIVLAVASILAVVAIKAFTDLGIPGWASTVSSSMLIILLQAFLLSLFTVFLYLTSSSQRSFIPAKHYSDHIESIDGDGHH